MKKWALPLSLAAGVLALSGCGNSEGNVIATSKAGDVTDMELYAEMKEKYGPQMEQALQELMQKKVLSDKYEVTDEELDKEVKTAKEQLGDQYEMFLAQYGLDEDGFKEFLKLELLREKAALADIKVTDKEVKEYYDSWQPEIQVSHILVEDEAKAKEVKQKLADGGDFAELAKEYSTDTGSAENGGSLGWIDNAGRAQFVPEFTKALSTLKVNQVSEPVKSDYGYHIIKITDQKEKASFEKMKSQMTEELKKSKVDSAALQEKLDKVMKDADVEVKDEDFKGAFDTEDATTTEETVPTEEGTTTKDNASTTEDTTNSDAAQTEEAK
ncbi:peptidylprolyl isomerase [Domibacillus sp. DTU_2020_1001157_1_SI_ALB_TIR_016]|uniref:peptidylprolyl isomerase n=1 Tax=Domibacillus sp. DTU_2020_1001157_1_SI_ALB_TIR_016 TaxID=3077789 RepID=UPI0028EA9F4A|nr:peptidylprolyl isomerase [Domibacillus sp. DTU_2020_1001157_1_SI_ALB_TIR_016]WNS80097.1 peptidylprolyl isomerase [Domibacillus sp. DTU_2020_1001157_1_SI_ALB_TIR_016]